MKRLIGTTTQLRKANKNKIYRLIYNEKQISRQDIANKLSLSLPTVNQNLKELYEMGLIDFNGRFESTGGRRASVISVIPDARLALGIEITLSYLLIAAVDLCGNRVAYTKINEIFVPNDTYSVRLNNHIESFIKLRNLDRTKILGVGIAIPGVLDREEAVLESAPTLRVKGMDIGIITKDILFLCTVDNEANAGGFAELWNREKANTIAYLSVAKGVGGSILINNELYKGVNNRGGEFGHITLVKDGKECSCGKRGCFEAYCSTARLSDELGCDLEQFFSSLDHKPHYRKLWTEYLEYLSMGINNIRMMLDCDVVLGGTLSKHINPFLPKIRDILSSLNSFEEKGDFLKICRYPSGGCAVGSALRHIEKYIDEV